ncbi:MAG: hypothetical protein LQ348_001602 [Seirophora lacunosa]|nr:MAG: hypothetical protein LQ348_001602 [Seirophora lacunosa]
MDRFPPRRPENHPASIVRSTTETIKFEQPAVFSFAQVVRHQQDSLPGYGSIPTSGHITVKAAHGSASQKGIWVETEVHSHDPSLVRITSSEAGVTISIPSTGPLAQAHSEQHRISVNSTIYISPNLALTSFALSTSSLSIAIPSGIPLSSQTPVHISAPFSPLTFSSHGPLSGLTIDALSISLSTTSSIHGAFTLRDALSLHTTSGSITITLALQPSSHKTTAPATLDVQSSSGSIAIHTTTLSKIPPRDYRSSISTSSGSIDASLVHGTRTALRSHSGRVNANLYPHGNTTLRSDIAVDTQSGSQDVVVHASLTDATAPLRHFFAHLHAISGSVRAAYPAQWEGRVDGSTVSGGISVAWPGLRVMKDERGPGRHALEGVKGLGEGVLGFRAVSGSVGLQGAEEVAVRERERGRGGSDGDGDESVAETETMRAPGREEDHRHHHHQVVLTPSSEAGDEWLEVQ